MDKIFMKMRESGLRSWKVFMDSCKAIWAFFFFFKTFC